MLVLARRRREHAAELHAAGPRRHGGGRADHGDLRVLQFDLCLRPERDSGCGLVIGATAPALARSTACAASMNFLGSGAGTRSALLRASGTKPSTGNLIDQGETGADRARRRLTVTKFLLGVATAALWFVLSHAANAEGIFRLVTS